MGPGRRLAGGQQLELPPTRRTARPAETVHQARDRAPDRLARL